MARQVGTPNRQRSLYEKEVGVWIDYKKAVIVTGDGETIEKLESNMEEYVRSK